MCDKFSWLSLISLFVSLISRPLYASDTVRQVVTPNDFPTVERFFLDANCRLIFLTAYLYNPQSGHWLSSGEAKQKLPEIAEMFTQDCQVKSPAAEVAKTFNLALPEQEGMLLLYVGPLQGMLEAEAFRSKYVKRYEQHIQLLQRLSDIPQYEISTPLTGLKSQF